MTRKPIQEPISEFVEGENSGTLSGGTKTNQMDSSGSPSQRSFRYRYELGARARLKGQLARAQEILFRQGSSVLDRDALQGLSVAVDRFVRDAVPPPPRVGDSSYSRSAEGSTDSGTRSPGGSRRRRRITNSQGRNK